MADQTNLPSQILVLANARPIRVAYLVADVEDAGRILDSVFSEAYGRWGGQWTIVAPIEDQGISSAYWSWLEWYDPDIVYSFTKLDDRLIATIERRLMPSQICVHENFRRPGATPDYRPRLPLSALSSLSILPALSIRTGIVTPKPRYVIDRYPLWKDDGFVLDNFGFAFDSKTAFPLQSPIDDFVCPLVLTPSDAPEDRWHFQRVGEEISDDRELLRRMAKDSSICGLQRLSAAIATPRTLQHHRWRESLNLVVGDSFADRLVFWNSRLLFSEWRSEELAAMRIPEKRVRDNDFRDALVEYVRARNFNSPTQQGDLGHICLRSCSVTEDDLSALAVQFRKETRSIVTSSRIESPDAVAPASDLLARSKPVFKGDTRQYVSQTKFILQQPYPLPLRDIAIVPPAMRSGSWMIDVKMQRHHNVSRFGNVEHWWCLPRRRQILRLFTPNDAARILRRGLFSFPNDHSNASPVISIPEDERVFEYLVARTTYYASGDVRHSRPAQAPYSTLRTSDKGRYLNGVLGIFGGVYAAHDILGDYFWRGVVTRLCESKTDNQEFVKDVADRMKERLRAKNGPLVLSENDEWIELAKATIREAQFVQRLPRFVRFDDLERWACEVVNSCIDRHRELENGRVELLKEVPDDLDDAMRSLCARGIFNQGYEWTCRRCGFHNWLSVDNVQMLMSCAVCRSNHHVSARFDWKFRLNDFLGESIREHGMLAILWLLAKLGWEGTESFFFAPPVELFLSFPESTPAIPACEVDVLCVVNGKLVVGEAKQTARLFRKDDAKTLANIAKRIDADIVVLGCLEPAARMLETRKQWIKSELGDAGPEVLVLYPSDDDGEPSHRIRGL